MLGCGAGSGRGFYLLRGGFSPFKASSWAAAWAPTGGFPCCDPVKTTIQFKTCYVKGHTGNLGLRPGLFPAATPRGGKINLKHDYVKGYTGELSLVVAFNGENPPLR